MKRKSVWIPGFGIPGLEYLNYIICNSTGTGRGTGILNSYYTMSLQQCKLTGTPLDPANPGTPIFPCSHTADNAANRLIKVK